MLACVCAFLVPARPRRDLSTEFRAVFFFENEQLLFPPKILWMSSLRTSRVSVVGPGGTTEQSNFPFTTVTRRGPNRVLPCCLVSQRRSLELLQRPEASCKNPRSSEGACGSSSSKVRCGGHGEPSSALRRFDRLSACVTLALCLAHILRKPLIASAAPHLYLPRRHHCIASVVPLFPGQSNVNPTRRLD